MAERTLPFDFPAPEPAPRVEAPPAKKGDAGSGCPGDYGLPVRVGELARALRSLFERSFPAPIWVEGEVTGARAATSGHLYFTLKDDGEDACIDVVVYKRDLTAKSRKLVTDGAKIRLRGRPAYWPPRGKMQFTADRIEPVGRGALLEALERLKEKLAAEGLFAPERRRPLPRDPRIIGVVTSAGGAVIHDICKVAFRRGGAKILLSPAQVQGAAAPESIVRALTLLARVAGVDVIIVGRGGGSSDDLMVWNDEGVVRAVASCAVPTVSAVGHEVDVTLTDAVADARAATPSEAAEMLVPDAEARRALLEQQRARLVRAMRATCTEEGVRLHRFARRLGDPRLAIASQQQRKDDLLMRAGEAVERAISRRHDAVRRLEKRLAEVDPRRALAGERATLSRLEERLHRHALFSLARRRGQLERLAHGLDAMSPLKVLGRGYAIVQDGGGRAVRSREDVTPGDRVSVRVAEGAFEAIVAEAESTEPRTSAEPRRVP